MSNKPPTTPKTKGWSRRSLSDAEMARQRSVLIWNSGLNGPYVRARHGQIGSR